MIWIHSEASAAVEAWMLNVRHGNTKLLIQIHTYQYQSINQSKHICIAPCVANESEAHGGEDL